MREIVTFTNMLPFCGKASTRKWYLDGIASAKNGDSAEKYKNAAYMLIFAYFHYIQLKLGIGEVRNEKNTNAILLSYDYIYSLANFLATYSQIYLSYKIAIHPTSTSPELRCNQNHRVKNSSFDILFTTIGQLLFLVTQTGR